MYSIPKIATLSLIVIVHGINVFANDKRASIKVNIDLDTNVFAIENMYNNYLTIELDNQSADTIKLSGVICGYESTGDDMFFDIRRIGKNGDTVKLSFAYQDHQPMHTEILLPPRGTDISSLRVFALYQIREPGNYIMQAHFKSETNKVNTSSNIIRFSVTK